MQVVIEGEKIQGYGKAATTNNGGWKMLLRGTLAEAGTAEPTKGAETTNLEDCSGGLPSLYQWFASQGMDYQDRYLTKIWQSNDHLTTRCQVRWPKGQEGGRVEALLQALGAALHSLPGDSSRVLAGMGSYAWHDMDGPANADVIVTRLDSSSGKEVQFNLEAYHNGKLLAAMTGIRVSTADMVTEKKLPELYRLEWIGKKRLPRAAEGFPPAINSANVEENIQPLLQDHRLDSYAAEMAGLNRSAAAYINQALEDLGADSVNGLSGQMLVDNFGVLPKYQRLADRLLEIREEYIGEDLSAYPEKTSPGTMKCVATEMELLRRCGPKLAGVLRGREDPLQLLFPAGDLSLGRRLYRDSSLAMTVNRIARETIREIIASLPDQGRLRILEVGAGTGGLTEHLLPILPPERTEYVFSDLSQHFLKDAAERYAQYDFVTYRIVNGEIPPKVEDSESFDIILAANVIHATPNIVNTMTTLGKYLAPGGKAILVEATAREAWLDLTFGLTDGWWSFNDKNIRTSHPLLTVSQWEKIFGQTGLGNFQAFTPESLGMGQSVLLARKWNQETRRRWLILNSKDSLNENFARELGQWDIETVTASIPLQADKAEIDHRLRMLLAGNDFERIIFCTDLSATPQACGISSEAVTLGNMFIELIRQLAACEHAQPHQLWLLTNKAQAVHDSELSLSAVPLWGLAETAALEHPEIWGGAIDIHSPLSPDNISELCVGIEYPDNEDRLIISDNERLAPRLRQITEQETGGEMLSKISAEGSYIILGGLGGLGLATARFLAEKGAGEIILASRRQIDGITSEQIKNLTSLASAVRAERCDISDHESLARLLAGAEKPLKGVIHAAGMAEFGPLSEISTATLEKVFAAKITGTLNLAEVLNEYSPDFILLYSSMVSVWGAVNQGAYAAANQFLDQFVHHCRNKGLPARVIDWCPISGGGMVPAEHLKELERIGIGSLSLDDVPQMLEHILATESEQVITARMDWEELTAAYQRRRPMPIFNELARQSSRKSGARNIALPSTEPAPAETPPTGGLVAELMSATEDSRRARIISLVTVRAATILEMEEGEEPDTDTGFFDMGFDSLTIMNLKQELEEDLSISLPGTVAFEFPTINSLAGFIASSLGESPETPPEPVAPTGKDEPAKNYMSAKEAIKPEAQEARGAAAPEGEVMEELDILEEMIGREI